MGRHRVRQKLLDKISAEKQSREAKKERKEEAHVKLHPILSLLSNNGFLNIPWRIIRLLWRISVGKIVEKGTIVMGALSAMT